MRKRRGASPAWLLAGTLALGTWVTGCRNDTAVSLIDTELVLAPELTDLGVVLMDRSVEFVLRAENIQGGDIAVRSVTLLDQAGDAFEYLGPQELIVPRGAGVELLLRYRPLSVGYHRARLSVTSDAGQAGLVADVRARAVLPDIALDPPVLEFGAVHPGGSRTRTARLRNDGVVEASVSAGESGHPAFQLAVDLPVVLDAGAEVELPVVFSPTTAEAAGGELELDLGDAGTVRLYLRGNDCVGGLPFEYDVDGDGVTSCAGDCDDLDAEVRPGAEELANSIDDDCDGVTDEGTEAADDDGDGFSEAEGDCADSDPTVSPGQTEVSGNGVDDDCDGQVDSGAVDQDQDGYAVIGGDCDDGDAFVFPGAVELPDVLDNDCDATVDEGTIAGDDDGDGYSEQQGDCDDGDLAVGPSAVELPNWVDDDCDGAIDEGTVQADDDGDGFSEAGGDCDDGDAGVSPAQVETVGNQIDEDCDGIVE